MARLIQRYILHFSLDWGPTLLIFIKGERQARQRLSRGFFHDSIERHESRHGRGAVRRDCRSLGSTGWDPKNAGAQDQQEDGAILLVINKFPLLFRLLFLRHSTLPGSGRDMEFAWEKAGNVLGRQLVNSRQLSRTGAHAVN